MTYSVTVAAEARATVSAAVSLIPGDQSRNWGNRWKEIQRDLARLLQPRTEPLSGVSTRAAERELLLFYVLTYHLKDLLIADTKVQNPTVEEAINVTPALALVCDLANLDKHGKLNRPARSGNVPAITRSVGSSLPSGGWVLEMEIQHGSNTRDGLQVARGAVDAWEQLLQGWSLI